MGVIIHASHWPSKRCRAGLPSIEHGGKPDCCINRSRVWSRAAGEKRIAVVAGTKLRMCGDAVIALEKIFDHKFPVGVGQVGRPVGNLCGAKAVKL